MADKRAFTATRRGDSSIVLTTTRLQLRLWRDEDLPSFAALNSDPRVMQYMPKTLDHRESDAFAERIRQHFVHHGFGLWAVESIGIADFIGFVGFSVPSSKPISRLVWRLLGGWHAIIGTSAMLQRQPVQHVTTASPSSGSGKSYRLLFQATSAPEG
jgi:RimJ/RimL family protein N-acetyltransferase